MKEAHIVEITGYFFWTEEQTNRIAKETSIKFRSDEKIPDYYWSSVKGEPNNPEWPEECWAITNRYDPRVVEARKQKGIVK